LYVCGFLKGLSQFTEQTLITASNFAICFGATIVQPNGFTEVNHCQRFSEIATDFITWTIEKMHISKYKYKK
jgi:hypothetical protein